MEKKEPTIEIKLSIKIHGRLYQSDQWLYENEPMFNSGRSSLKGSIESVSQQICDMIEPVEVHEDGKIKQNAFCKQEDLPHYMGNIDQHG